MPNPAPAAPTAPTDTRRFITRLQQSLADGSFVKLGLGRPHGGDPTLLKLLARRVVIKGQDQVSLVWRHRTKDITKNLPLADGLAQVAALLGPNFRNAHLDTTTEQLQLVLSKKGKGQLVTHAVAGADG